LRTLGDGEIVSEERYVTIGVGRGATWLSPGSWCIVLQETWETPLSC
jgi:hypothetical protein